jgi:hypothetical protein
MRLLLYCLFIFFAADAIAQTPLPHGMVYGAKPDTTLMLPATKLETYMGHKTRISTTIRGKVTKVTKEKGGWFEVDAGNGKVIAAHFKNYNISIPAGLKGKTIIMQGVSAKQFIADDSQHFAGDSVVKKPRLIMHSKAKLKIDFEVMGLMID